MKSESYKTLRGGTKVALDQYNRIVREMPRHVEKRMQNIAAINEILPAGLQRLAALNHIGQLDATIHRLAGKGLESK